MTPFLELPAARPIALFTTLLLLKMFVAGAITANNRRKSKIVLNPEDVGVNPGSHAEPQEADSTLRAKRAHQNDLENIPGFLILFALFGLAGGSQTAGWAYGATYFAARLLHTICYLNGVQPFRTASFALGWVVMFGLMVQLMMKTFM